MISLASAAAVARMLDALLPTQRVPDTNTWEHPATGAELDSLSLTLYGLCCSPEAPQRGEDFRSSRNRVMQRAAYGTGGGVGSHRANQPLLGRSIHVTQRASDLVERRTQESALLMENSAHLSCNASSASDHVDTASGDEGGDPSSLTQHKVAPFGGSDQESVSTSLGSAESSFNKSVNGPELLNFVEGAAETDLEEGNVRYFEGAPAVSPPPKRKRLTHAMLNGLRRPATANYFLIEKGPVARSLICTSTFEDGLTEDARVVSLVTESDSESPEAARPACTTGRKYTLLHNIAMVLTFTSIVSLWGILDVLVELAAGFKYGAQLQLYGLLLVVGALMTLALRKLKSMAYRGTFYPTLLSSLITAAGGWGVVDVAVEVAAGADQTMMLLSYFLIFLGTGFCVALHVLLVDGGFSEALDRFI
ncbi:hypothetical protein Emag_006962 [Eimeria magna]